MSKRLDGTSMFTGINSGLSNTFSLLTNQYSDGLTLENLKNSLTNTAITSSTYGTTFASYLTNNFSSLDSDSDGVISSSEIQSMMNKMSTEGLTREQIVALAGSSGLTSLQETVLSHFDSIDKNHDGKVTNQEIQEYGIDSDVHDQKTADMNRMISNMSLYYDTDVDTEGSLLDYKYLSEDE